MIELCLKGKNSIMAEIKGPEKILVAKVGNSTMLFQTPVEKEIDKLARTIGG